MELEEELSSAKKKAGSPEATEYPAYNEKNFDAMIRKAGIKVPEKAPSPRILSS